MGKGSGRRPKSIHVTDGEFEDSWARIFKENNQDPVKREMDKTTRPSTHKDKKKEAKKTGEYYESE